MTTIAFRDGVLAGDSRTCYGNSIETGIKRKVRKSRDGRLIGVCGTSSKVEPYALGLMNDAKVLPEIPKDEGRVIEVLPSGRVWIHEHGGKHCLGKLRFGAWGSGSDSARGALAMGATAVETVRVASTIDLYTDGRITVVRL